MKLGIMTPREARLREFLFVPVEMPRTTPQRYAVLWNRDGKSFTEGQALAVIRLELLKLFERLKRGEEV